jgi:hypothetical protein
MTTRASKTKILSKEKIEVAFVELNFGNDFKDRVVYMQKNCNPLLNRKGGGNISNKDKDEESPHITFSAEFNIPS